MNKLLLVLCFFLVSFNCPVEWAKKEVGVTEIGGNNKGERVAFYLKEAKIYTPAPWCAAFVITAFNHCEIQHTITAWSPTSFNKKDVIYTGKAFKQAFHKDDVMTMSLSYDKFKEDKSRYLGIGHTGVVVRLYKSSVVTIEGNTNDDGDRDSRSGDGVFIKRRPLTKNTHITRWKKHSTH